METTGSVWTSLWTSAPLRSYDRRSGDRYLHKRWNRISLLSYPSVLWAKLRRACSYSAWPVLAPLARRRRKHLKDSVSVVAVVGSFGKTTAARTIGAVLDCSTVSGRNSWSFLALGILGLGRDAKSAVFEVAIARRGQMCHYARLLRPDVTVVTSIGSEHLLSMKNLEGVRQEKSVMVAVMDSDGLVLLNGDDPNVLWMRDRTKAKVVTFGFGEENDIRARGYKVNWPHGTQFKLHTVTGAWDVDLPLIGRPMVYSALAAAAVGISQGIEVETILERLGGLQPAPGRMEPTLLSSGAWALRDDHKSGIETIQTAIRTLAEIDAPRRIAVLGDITEEMGSVRAIYRDLGDELGQIADLLLLTGRHARSVAVGARRAGMAAEAVIDCGKNIFKATEILESYLLPGDVLLLKGRYEQRLRRIALALAGKTVNCRLSQCDVKGLHCETCPALAKGWPSNLTEI